MSAFANSPVPAAEARGGPRPIPPGEASGGDGGARGRVLSAAVELFADQGYDGTSISQVIARAGLTKGGFYHHFASKQALLFEVYGDLIGRQLDTMEQILGRRLPLDQTLRLLIVDLVESTAASAQRALVFRHELGRLGHERTADYRAARRRYHDAVRKLIRQGQASGAFAKVASADTITFAIFGVINELPLWYDPAGRKKPHQIGTELADFVLRAMEV